MTAPCNGCKERTMGCHANCKKYIEYKKIKDGINQKRRKEHEVNRNADEFRTDGIKRMIRGKR